MTDVTTGEALRYTLIHGLGGRSDLPIPVPIAQYTAMAVLLVTVVLLGSKWRHTRHEGPIKGKRLPRLQRLIDSTTWRNGLLLIGFLGLTAFVTVSALGSDDSSLNPAPTWLYVWLWVGLVPLSLAFGPVVAKVNPFRAITTAINFVADRRERDLRAYPARLAYWPAVAALFAFLWLELVKDEADLPATALTFVALYGAIQVIGGLRYGPTWYERADGFEVYSRFLGLLSPFARDGAGRLVLTSPLRHITRFPDSGSATWVVYVLLGATAFDGLTRTEWWSNLSEDASGPWYEILGTLGLVGAIAVVALLFAAACRLTAASMKKRADRSFGAVQRTFAHSLIPVLLGYTVAHYFSLLVFQGQAGWLLVTDPFGTGADLLGTADVKVNYTAVSSATIAWVQVTAILIGHVIGVASAHDRALKVLSEDETRSGQYPIVTCMIVFTFIGLGLLLGA